ncbi:hypothetical protein TWF696_003930 [Orbilia brochopaga]|uniref:Uncharacterized protein n=1 Tax=Orbilia brochopaga TaxID=3140254 RepID=A0AAV9V7A3_9PEZI
MPGQSRLLILAISSLLVSSTWASAHVRARDTSYTNGVAQCYSGDSNCAGITENNHGRFRRVKRQEATTLGADAAALGDASDQIAAAIDQGAPVEQVTTAATDIVADASNLLSDVNGGTVDVVAAEIDTQTPTTDTALPVPPQSPSDANTDVTDEVKLLADETQNFISNTGAALQDDAPFTEENLQDLATDIQQITAEMASLPPPATVDIPSQVSDQIQTLKNANLTEEELWAKLELVTGESLNKDVQFQTMLSYLTPILAATVAGNVTLPATEGLPAIQPVAEITNGTIPVGDAAATLSRLRLAKRGHLEKRFLGSLFSFLGIGFAASASASLTTPLGSLGIGVAATLGKLAEVKPAPPEQPQTVYVYEKEYIPQQPPVVIQNGAQQPAAIANVPIGTISNTGATGGRARTGGFLANTGSNGHIDTPTKWAYYRD